MLQSRIPYVAPSSPRALASTLLRSSLCLLVRPSSLACLLLCLSLVLLVVHARMKIPSVSASHLLFLSQILWPLQCRIRILPRVFKWIPSTMTNSPSAGSRLLFMNRMPSILWRHTPSLTKKFPTSLFSVEKCAYFQLAFVARPFGSLLGKPWKKRWSEKNS